MSSFDTKTALIGPIRSFEERHPVTGEWRTMQIFEFARADYEQMLKRLGADEKEHYGDISASTWAELRNNQ